MRRLTTLIADDELPARRRIRVLLEAIEGWRVIAETRDGRTTLEAIRKCRPDLVFLDIAMPGLSGFDVLHALDSTEFPEIIFITAYDQHAVDAFEVQALDYLLKPFEDERFYQALERARRWIRKGTPPPVDFSALLPRGNTGSRRENRRILIRQGSRNLFLDVRRICWVGAEGVYLRIHSEGSSYLIRRSLKSLESTLPSYFLRIHRSTLVNARFVRQSEHRSHGDYTLVLEDGTRLRASRTYRENLERLR